MHLSSQSYAASCAHTGQSNTRLVCLLALGLEYKPCLHLPQLLLPQLAYAVRCLDHSKGSYCASTVEWYVLWHEQPWGFISVPGQTFQSVLLLHAGSPRAAYTCSVFSYTIQCRWQADAVCSRGACVPTGCFQWQLAANLQYWGATRSPRARRNFQP